MQSVSQYVWMCIPHTLIGVGIHCLSTGIVYMVALTLANAFEEQRREDMTSCHSDNLHTPITFQGQEPQMQFARMALWTKS